VQDGNYDVEAIIAALVEARATEDKRVFVNIRTIIGVGSKVAGNAKAHGAALGPEDVANIKRESGMDPEQHFVIPDTVYEFFHEVKSRGAGVEQKWNELLEAYKREYPELAMEFEQRMRGEMIGDWTKMIPAKEDLSNQPTPSRKSAGLVCNALASRMPNVIVGTADLTPSVNMEWKDAVHFQNVSSPQSNVRYWH
jgi:dihydroxyacetone synthase